MKKEIYFYKKGYRVTETGNVINPKGDKINPCFQDKTKRYKEIGTKNNNKSIKCPVHRLQAFQKYGEVLFFEGIEVRHKNGIKTDNSFSNILIGTSSQNTMDIPEAIRMARALHAASFLRKYNKQEVSEFFYNNKNSYKKTMNKFNISSKGTLHYILYGRKKKQLSLVIK